MASTMRSSGGRKRGRRRAHGAMSDINVTPLVDVMLVLLIVFMITAPLLTTGVAVDLPKAGAKAISAQDNAPVEISIDLSGHIFLGDTEVDVNRLKGLLAAIAQANVERRVYIRADQKLSYGRVMDVMGAVSSVGFKKVALITDPAATIK